MNIHTLWFPVRQAISSAPYQIVREMKFNIRLAFTHWLSYIYELERIYDYFTSCVINDKRTDRGIVGCLCELWMEWFLGVFAVDSLVDI